ncbi:MAG: hypothetical protein KGP28_06215 [Bdellovibrionales bacterium]|nr:hypothetical protein [Bdellovibrionales bacterium]
MPIRFPMLLLSLFLFTQAHAQFDEGSFRQALKLKKNLYITEGSISGGDRTQSNFKVASVRIAANPAGYDRVVIDLAESKRPPFFMVQNDPGTHRVLVTLYGKAKLDFSSQTAIQAARKTKSIKNLDFIPLVESDRWMFSMECQAGVKSEVFELTDPSRIIIDLKP